MGRIKELEQISKVLSLVLRYKPQEIGIVLDNNGYTDVAILIKKLNITFEELVHIVYTNNKKRFAFNNDNTLIRANQGHSIKDVDIQYSSDNIPDILYHGTSSEFISLINQSGLLRMNRNHVHLSKDLDTAINVAKRKNSNIVIFEIKAKQMLLNGIKILRSDNDIYLTDHVPSKYIYIKCQIKSS